MHLRLNRICMFFSDRSSLCLFVCCVWCSLASQGIYFRTWKAQTATTESRRLQDAENALKCLPVVGWIKGSYISVWCSRSNYILQVRHLKHWFKIIFRKQIKLESTVTVYHTRSFHSRIKCKTSGHTIQLLYI